MSARHARSRYSGCVGRRSESFDALILYWLASSTSKDALRLVWDGATETTLNAGVFIWTNSIDFTQIDLGEYTDDLTRQMLNQEQVGSKISNLLEKYMSGIPQ